MQQGDNDQYCSPQIKLYMCIQWVGTCVSAGLLCTTLWLAAQSIWFWGYLSKLSMPVANIPIKSFLFLVLYRFVGVQPGDSHTRLRHYRIICISLPVCLGIAQSDSTVSSFFLICILSSTRVYGMKAYVMHIVDGFTTLRTFGISCQPPSELVVGRAHRWEQCVVLWSARFVAVYTVGLLDTWWQTCRI